MEKQKEVKKINKKAAIVIPSKKTMNFVHHKSSFNPKKMIPLILVLVIASAVFIKFGIVDLMQEKSELYGQLADRQEHISGMEIALSDYDEIAEKFGRYSYGWMTDEEGGLVGRMDVFKLIESKISPNAFIENVALNQNALSMNIHGITLEAASEMVKDLETSDLVTSATIHSAVAADAEESTISLSINLAKPQDEVPDATDAAKEDK